MAAKEGEKQGLWAVLEEERNLRVALVGIGALWLLSMKLVLLAAALPVLAYAHFRWGGGIPGFGRGRPRSPSAGVARQADRAVCRQESDDEAQSDVDGDAEEEDGSEDSRPGRRAAGGHDGLEADPYQEDFWEEDAPDRREGARPRGPRTDLAREELLDSAAAAGGRVEASVGGSWPSGGFPARPQGAGRPTAGARTHEGAGGGGPEQRHGASSRTVPPRGQAEREPWFDEDLVPPSLQGGRAGDGCGGRGSVCSDDFEELDDILQEALEEEGGPLRLSDFDAGSKRILKDLMQRDRATGTRKAVEALERLFERCRPKDRSSVQRWPAYVYAILQDGANPVAAGGEQRRAGPLLDRRRGGERGPRPGDIQEAWKYAPQGVEMKLDRWGKPVVV